LPNSISYLKNGTPFEQILYFMQALPELRDPLARKDVTAIQVFHFENLKPKSISMF
jgi:hypothetical protein